MQTNQYGLVLDDGTVWRYCSVPDCEFCVCIWATDNLCYRHSYESIGEADMKARYEASHSITWDEFMNS